ncbi:PQ loop repeat-domain-containing protein [Blastocladiella britannica]|nr:PQ loop repeat-domain-containing protein [Blastocladiella britannica]
MSSSDIPCICNPASLVIDGIDYPYSQLWGSALGECIYTPRQTASEIIGLASIAGYAVAFLPQVWHSYQRKSVEGFTFSFFVMFAAGDMVTLLGAFLTQQFATQRWLAVLFAVESVILGVQFAYYNLVYPRLERRRQLRTADDDAATSSAESALVSQPPPPQTVSLAASLIPMAIAAGVALARRAASSSTAAATAATVLTLASAPICDATPELSPAAHTAGWVTAWLSAAIFLVSRFGQIRTNYKTKSSTGVSPWFIFMLFFNNVLYMVSVLLRIDEVSATKMIEGTLPFLLGSAGPIAQDAVLLVQWFMYRKNTVVPVADQNGEEESDSDLDEDEEGRVQKKRPMSSSSSS